VRSRCPSATPVATASASSFRAIAKRPVNQTVVPRAASTAPPARVARSTLSPSIHDDTSGTAMRAPSAIPPRPRTATATKYPNVTRPYLRLSANRTAVISAQR